MRIEPGGPPRYQGLSLIKGRGWTHWHHVFPARHLLILGLIRKHSRDANTFVMLSRILNFSSKLCVWSTSKAGTSRPGGGARTGGGSDNPTSVFYGSFAMLVKVSVFDSYLDESSDEKQESVVCVASFLARERHWRCIQQSWVERLAKNGVKYFSAKECKAVQGPRSIYAGSLNISE